MDQPQPESPAPRTGSGYLVGSGILVILHGFLAMLRDRTSTITAAYAIGTFVGGAVVVALIGLIIYGVARAIGKAKPASTAAKIVFWILLVFLILGAANFVGRAVNPRTASAQAGFTNEERLGLRVGADSIRHVGLGFVLPHPGAAFNANPDVDRQLAEKFGGQLPPDLINWAFTDTTRGWSLVIQVIGMPGLNERKFLEFMRGHRAGLAKSKVFSDTAVWEETQRESRLTLRQANGLHILVRCVPSLKPRREYVVCAQIYSNVPAALTAVSNGLAVTK